MENKELYRDCLIIQGMLLRKTPHEEILKEMDKVVDRVRCKLNIHVGLEALAGYRWEIPEELL